MKPGDEFDWRDPYGRAPALVEVYRRTALNMNRPEYAAVIVILGRGDSPIVLPFADLREAYESPWRRELTTSNTTYAALISNWGGTPQIEREFPFAW